MLAYESTKTKILDYIRENHLQSGDRLPTETELSRLLSVGRMTLREGLNALKNEGIILSVQGSGTFVAAGVENIADTLNVNTSVTDMIRAGGHVPGTTFFRKEIVPVDAAAAAALHVTEGSDVPVCSRVRTADGKPVVFMKDYLAPAIAGSFFGLTEDDLSLYRYIEENCDCRIGSCVTELRPAAADACLAERLEVAEGTLLLQMINVVNDVYGAPLIYAEEFFLADKFRFMITRGKA